MGTNRLYISKLEEVVYGVIYAVKSNFHSATEDVFIQIYHWTTFLLHAIFLALQLLPLSVFNPQLFSCENSRIECLLSYLSYPFYLPELSSLLPYNAVLFVLILSLFLVGKYIDSTSRNQSTQCKPLLLYFRFLTRLFLYTFLPFLFHHLFSTFSCPSLARRLSPLSPLSPLPSCLSTSHILSIIFSALSLPLLLLLILLLSPIYDIYPYTSSLFKKAHDNIYLPVVYFLLTLFTVISETNNSSTGVLSLLSLLSISLVASYYFTTSPFTNPSANAYHLALMAFCLVNLFFLMVSFFLGQESIEEISSTWRYFACMTVACVVWILSSWRVERARSLFRQFMNIYQEDFEKGYLSFFQTFLTETYFDEGNEREGAISALYREEKEGERREESRGDYGGEERGGEERGGEERGGEERGEEERGGEVGEEGDEISNRANQRKSEESDSLMLGGITPRRQMDPLEGDGLYNIDEHVEEVSVSSFKNSPVNLIQSLSLSETNPQLSPSPISPLPLSHYFPPPSQDPLTAMKIQINSMKLSPHIPSSHSNFSPILSPPLPTVSSPTKASAIKFHVSPPTSPSCPSPTPDDPALEKHCHSLLQRYQQSYLFKQIKHFLLFPTDIELFFRCSPLSPLSHSSLPASSLASHQFLLLFFFLSLLDDSSLSQKKHSHHRHLLTHFLQLALSLFQDIHWNSLLLKKHLEDKLSYSDKFTSFILQKELDLHRVERSFFSKGRSSKVNLLDLSLFKKSIQQVKDNHQQCIKLMKKISRLLYHDHLMLEKGVTSISKEIVAGRNKMIEEWTKRMTVTENQYLDLQSKYSNNPELISLSKNFSRSFFRDNTEEKRGDMRREEREEETRDKTARDEIGDEREATGREKERGEVNRADEREETSSSIASSSVNSYSPDKENPKINRLQGILESSKHSFSMVRCVVLIKFFLIAILLLLSGILSIVYINDMHGRLDEMNLLEIYFTEYPTICYTVGHLKILSNDRYQKISVPMVERMKEIIASNQPPPPLHSFPLPSFPSDLSSSNFIEGKRETAISPNLGFVLQAAMSVEDLCKELMDGLLLKDGTKPFIYGCRGYSFLDNSKGQWIYNPQYSSVSDKYLPLDDASLEKLMPSTQNLSSVNNNIIKENETKENRWFWKIIDKYLHAQLPREVVINNQPSSPGHPLSFTIPLYSSVASSPTPITHIINLLMLPDKDVEASIYRTKTYLRERDEILQESIKAIINNASLHNNEITLSQITTPSVPLRHFLPFQARSINIISLQDLTYWISSYMSSLLLSVDEEYLPYTRFDDMNAFKLISDSCSDDLLRVVVSLFSSYIDFTQTNINSSLTVSLLCLFLSFFSLAATFFITNRVIRNQLSIFNCADSLKLGARILFALSREGKKVMVKKSKMLRFLEEDGGEEKKTAFQSVVINEYEDEDSDTPDKGESTDSEEEEEKRRQEKKEEEKRARKKERGGNRAMGEVMNSSVSSSKRTRSPSPVDENSPSIFLFDTEAPVKNSRLQTNSSKSELLGVYPESSLLSDSPSLNASFNKADILAMIRKNSPSSQKILHVTMDKIHEENYSLLSVSPPPPALSLSPSHTPPPPTLSLPLQTHFSSPPNRRSVSKNDDSSVALSSRERSRLEAESRRISAVTEESSAFDDFEKHFLPAHPLDHQESFSRTDHFREKDLSSSPSLQHKKKKKRKRKCEKNRNKLLKFLGYNPDKNTQGFNPYLARYDNGKLLVKTGKTSLGAPVYEESHSQGFLTGAFSKYYCLYLLLLSLVLIGYSLYSILTLNQFKQYRGDFMTISNVQGNLSGVLLKVYDIVEPNFMYNKDNVIDSVTEDYQEYIASAKKSFFSLIQSRDDSVSIVRRYPMREQLVFDNVCINARTNCTVPYPNHEKMTVGLYRSFFTWIQEAQWLYTHLAGQVTQIMVDSPSTMWFLINSYPDLSQGLSSLKFSFVEETKITKDKYFNALYVFMAVVYLIIILCAIAIEALIHKKKGQLIGSIMILRIIPWSIITQEKILNSFFASIEDNNEEEEEAEELEINVESEGKIVNSHSPPLENNTDAAEDLKTPMRYTKKLYNENYSSSPHTPSF